MKLRLFIPLICILFFNGLEAQRNRNLTASVNTYIYKLNVKEAENLFLFPKTIIDSTFFHTLYDSVPVTANYSKIPAAGHYLFVVPDQLSFRYQVVTITSMNIHVVNTGKDFALRITEKATDKPVADASVTLSGRLVPYDVSHMSYLLPGSQKNGKLKIEARGETLFLSTKSERSAKRDSYDSSPNGFIAFSRPRYRQGDTVKLKAFIYYKNKPMQEELELRVKKEEYYWKGQGTIFKTRLHPVSPGAYVCQFVVGDSFKMDRKYPVEVYRTNKVKKGRDNPELFSSSFQTEDYQLDQTKYSIRTSKKTYSAGDSITVFLSGTDFNGLPLFDASAEVEVITHVILDPALDSEDFAFSIYKNTHSLEPSGETRIDLPPARFSSSGVQYKVRARFRNSNNELHADSAYFTIKQQVQHIEVADHDSVYEITYSKKGKKQSMLGSVTFVGKDRDSLGTISFTFPGTVQPLANVNSLLIKCDGIQEEYDLTPKRLSLYGYRNKDSVFAGVENPGAMLFNWELYRNGIKIKDSVGRHFNYKASDPGHTPYRIITHLCDERINECQVLNILPKEKTLQVEMKQPSETYPGGEAAVSVKVRDYDAKPVKDANITLSCINAQFNSQPLAYAPNYNKSAKLKKHAFRTYQIWEDGVQNDAGFKKYWYKRLRLDTIPFYHIHNPGASLYTHYFPVSTNQPQFAPFIATKNGLSRIYFIYVDDQPVFVLGSFYYSKYGAHQDHSPWSFLVPEGKHTVRLRTYDKEYTLTNVEFRKGQKLELSFSKDQPPSGIVAVKRGKHLTKEEKEVVNKNVLLLDNIAGYSYEDQYFWQGNNFKALQSRSFTTFHPNDTVHFQLNEYSKSYEGSFVFQPGFEYQIAGSEVTKKPYVFNISKLHRYYYYKYQDTGDTAITAARLKKNFEYLYGDRPYGACPEGTYTETENGSYLLLEDEGLSVYRMELARTDQFDGVVAFQRDWRSPFGGQKKKVENLKPGIYKATYYDEKGNYFVKNSIHIQSGKMHLDKVYKKDFKPLASLHPENVKCDVYDLSYTNTPLQISGSFLAARNTGDITTYLMHNGRVEGQMKSDAAGNFLAKVKEPGIYDLFVVPDTTYKNITIYSLTVSENCSPSLKIRLSPTYDSIHHFSSYNLAYQGKNIELHSHIASGAALEVIQCRHKTQTPHPLEHSFWMAGQNSSPQAYYDETQLEVDGTTLYSYNGRRHIFIHHRRRASFYRSRYSTFGWAGGKSGGFENRQVMTEEDRDGAEDKDLASVLYTEPGVLANQSVALQEVTISTRGSRARLGKFSHDLNPDYLSDPSSFSADSTRNDRFIPKKQMRKAFSDCAYWQPNLLTNDSGQVQFRFHFPDDVTGWKAGAIAITANKQSGEATAFTKSYKPLLASLNTPRFLLPGDSTLIIGKVMNYGKTPLRVKTLFKLKNETLSQSTQLVSNGFNQSQLIVAPTEDSLRFEYSLESAGGYFDGVQQTVPICPIGTEESKGVYYFLEKDSVFHFTLDSPGAYTEITVLDNDLDVLIAKMKDLSNYPYYCNEQMASKLNALLQQKIIDEKMGLSFKGEKEVKRLLHKLEKAQRPDGSWGWWDDAPSGNIFMTTWITHVLGLASRTSYTTSSLQKGLDNLRFQLPALNGSELLHAMSVLSENKNLSDAAKYIAEAQKEKNPSMWTRYTLLLLKQQNGINIDTDLAMMLKEKKETVLGGCYWGEPSTDWYDNRNQLSLMAYRILEKEKGQEKNVQGIRNYFLEHSDANTWRNTYETASILETILPAIVGKYDPKKSKPTVDISGGMTASVKEFPYTARVKTTDNTIQVTKKGGGAVYFSAYRKNWNTHPEKKEDLYAVKTWFEENGKKSENLPAGQVTTMKAEIVARKKADYIMIEIPIPAGCSYNNKNQPYAAYEIHREYLKNKVLIFCESLPAGTWTFDISLQPRYTGNYTLNPAKVELMYFPLFYGRNDIRRVKID